MKKGIYLIPFATFAFAQDYQVHVLKENETLSELLKDKGYRPLYGPNSWVEKTLAMNHLTMDSAKKIKKGFPIILPGKPEVVDIEVEMKELTKDLVSTKNAAISRSGIFGNTISEHQEVFLEVDYYTNSIKTQDETINMNENYGLGLSVNGLNDYFIGDLSYNYYGSFFVYSHGSSQFENSTRYSNSFEPTYKLKTGIALESPEIGFEFGPEVLVEERSRIYEEDDNYKIGRDRTGWIGFRAQKTHEIDHLRYISHIGYSRKVLQQSIDDTNIFAASELSAGTKVNLSDDYYFGVKVNSTQYDNINVSRESGLGVNFSYNLK